MNLVYVTPIQDIIISFTFTIIEYFVDKLIKRIAYSTAQHSFTIKLALLARQK